MEICTCGLIKQSRAGTTVDEHGVERCNVCRKPVEMDPRVIESSSSAVAPRMVTTLAEIPGHRIVQSHGVVTELAATSGFTATSKGTIAMDIAMENLRRSAARSAANAIVGLHSSAFGAAGGITSAFGGDAVGVLLVGTAVTVEADVGPPAAQGPP